MLAVPVAVVLFACDPGIAITFQNDTSEDILIDINGGGFEEVGAGEETSIGHLTDGEEEFRIIAKTADAERVIYDETFTREELDQMDNRIVITDTQSRLDGFIQGYQRGRISLSLSRSAPT